MRNFTPLANAFHTWNTRHAAKFELNQVQNAFHRLCVHISSQVKACSVLRLHWVGALTATEFGAISSKQHTHNMFGCVRLRHISEMKQQPVT